MRKILLLLFMVLFMVSVSYAIEIKIGEKIPQINIEEKGFLVPEYEIINGKMIYKADTDINYKKWSSSELTGRIGVVYHLAARLGADEINKPFIDALMAADLPEYLPDSPYKTTTILNTDDAVWGTAGIASGRFENSLKENTYAYFANDENGVAQKSWGLKKKGSAIIIHDKEGKVLYFKDGKMTQDEIQKGILIIQNELTAAK